MHPTLLQPSAVMYIVYTSLDCYPLCAALLLVSFSFKWLPNDSTWLLHDLVCVCCMLSITQLYIYFCLRVFGYWQEATKTTFWVGSIQVESWIQLMKIKLEQVYERLINEIECNIWTLVTLFTRQMLGYLNLGYILKTSFSSGMGSSWDIVRILGLTGVMLCLSNLYKHGWV